MSLQLSNSERDKAPRGVLPFDSPENIYGHRKRLFWIIRQIEKRNTTGKSKDKTKVLEIGCGTGMMLSIPLAALGYDVLGTDLDKASIDFANSVNPYANAQFICCDAAELSDSYDVIILSEVLEHLKDPDRLLKVSYDMLSAQGILIITVPNGYGWFELEQFLWGRLCLGSLLELLKIYWSISVIKGKLTGWHGYTFLSSLSSSPHVQRFTLGKIKSMVARDGFVIIEIEGSTLCAGRFSNLFLTGFKIPMRINNILGTILKPLASGFYLCCTKG